jgi:hypothetical protein
MLFLDHRFLSRRFLQKQHGVTSQKTPFLIKLNSFSEVHFSFIHYFTYVFASKHLFLSFCLSFPPVLDFFSIFSSLYRRFPLSGFALNHLACMWRQMDPTSGRTLFRLMQWNSTKRFVHIYTFTATFSFNSRLNEESSAWNRSQFLFFCRILVPSTVLQALCYLMCLCWSPDSAQIISGKRIPVQDTGLSNTVFHDLWISLGSILIYGESNVVCLKS